MDIVKELERLEDSFYGDWEEDKAPLIKELLVIHAKAGEDEDLFNRFLVQTADRFGGVYIPYLFWDKLSYFLEVPEERTWIQKLIESFVDSNFEEEEQKKMKLLLVTYFAKEKDFEVDKIRALILDKAHPDVKEYFQKLISFVKKNAKATEIYCDKFGMLKDVLPDFDLLSLPVTQLKERLAGV
ncbi:MAG: hypothetical protein AAF587_19565 [Bacteroidota bacterium]